MGVTILTALHKATNFVKASISKLEGLTKPRVKFFLWLLKRWWLLPVRYNFLNLSRYGGYAEKTLRRQFEEKLPFVSMFDELYSALKQKECILAFDPTFIAKAGKKTPGVGYFWNGCHQRSEKGLEAGVLAIIEVGVATAYHLEAVQTEVSPQSSAGDGGKRMSQYAKMIADNKETIQHFTKVVVADGYFMKKGFIEDLQGEGFEVVTKARKDANLKYLYKGKQKAKGRPRLFSGKVALDSIDLRVWKRCCTTDDIVAYEAVVYSVNLKCKVKAVYIKEGEGYDLLISTDIKMEGARMLKYYGLRFQIEFLIRDAKSHAGLEHCQARREEKLYNHFNMALFSVSLVRWKWWRELGEEQRKQTPFSMRRVKTCALNRYMAENIFSNLGLDMSCKKVKRLFNQCLDIGQMAA